MTSLEKENNEMDFEYKEISVSYDNKAMNENSSVPEDENIDSNTPKQSFNETNSKTEYYTEDKTLTNTESSNNQTQKTTNELTTINNDDSDKKSTNNQIKKI